MYCDNIVRPEQRTRSPCLSQRQRNIHIASKRYCSASSTLLARSTYKRPLPLRCVARYRTQRAKEGRHDTSRQGRGNRSEFCEQSGTCVIVVGRIDSDSEVPSNRTSPLYEAGELIGTSCFELCHLTSPLFATACKTASVGVATACLIVTVWHGP